MASYGQDKELELNNVKYVAAQITKPKFTAMTEPASAEKEKEQSSPLQDYGPVNKVVSIEKHTLPPSKTKIRKVITQKFATPEKGEDAIITFESIEKLKSQEFLDEIEHIEWHPK